MSRVAATDPPVQVTARALLPGRATLLILAMLCGAMLLPIWYVHAASTNVPYADTWGYMPMIGHYLHGRLSLRELFSGHNENRTVVLNLVLLLSCRYDSLNLVHIEYLGVLLLGVTVLAMLAGCGALFRSRPGWQVAAFLCVILLMASLAQWENLLLPINVVFFAAIAFGVSAILLLHRHLSRRSARLLSPEFLGAIALSELALLSMSGGVAVWPINALQIAMSPPPRRVRRELAIYVVIALLSVAGYLFRFGPGTDVLLSLAHPLRLGAALLIGQGNAMVGFFHNAAPVRLDFAIGAVLVLCYAAVGAVYLGLSPHARQASLGIVCIILFGIAEQLLIGIGRLSYGVSYDAASRYATLTMIAPGAALLFLAWHAERSRFCAVIAVLLGGAICLLSLLADQQEIAMAAARRHYGENLQHLLRDGPIGDAEARMLEWGPVQGGKLQDIQDGNRMLRAYRLSFYRTVPGSTRAGEPSPERSVAPVSGPHSTGVAASR